MLRITTIWPTMFGASFQRCTDDGCRTTAAMVNEMSMNPNEQRQTFDALIRQHLPLRPAKLRMLMKLREFAEDRSILIAELRNPSFTPAPNTCAANKKPSEYHDGIIHFDRAERTSILYSFQP